MKPLLSSAQIQKLIANLPESEKQLIMKKINIPNVSFDFAKAYGLNKMTSKGPNFHIGLGQTT